MCSSVHPSSVNLLFSVRYLELIPWLFLCSSESSISLLFYIIYLGLTHMFLCSPSSQSVVFHHIPKIDNMCSSVPLSSVSLVFSVRYLELIPWVPLFSPSRVRRRHCTSRSSMRYCGWSCRHGRLALTAPLMTSSWSHKEIR